MPRASRPSTERPSLTTLTLAFKRADNALSRHYAQDNPVIAHDALVAMFRARDRAAVALARQVVREAQIAVDEAA